MGLEEPPEERKRYGLEDQAGLDRGRDTADDVAICFYSHTIYNIQTYDPYLFEPVYNRSHTGIIPDGSKGYWKYK